MFNDLADRVIFGNLVKDYATVLLIFLVTFIFLYLMKKIVIRHVKKFADKTDTELDNFVIENFEKYGFPVLYVTAAYYLVTSLLNLPESLTRAIYAVFLVLIITYAIRFIIALVKYILAQYWLMRQGEDEAERNVKGLSTFISIIIWTIGFVFLIDNLGFKISGIMAGIGIGGITLALASQAILGDLFSYFVIFFDRPFEIGDFIIVDDKLGVVEKIGIKTTRVKSLDGEQLVFSNTDLTKSRLHNFKKMKERRVEFGIGITYQTPVEILERIPAMLRGIVESAGNTSFDRAHFTSFGDSSLDFEVVYHVYGPDYKLYRDIQQDINLKIFKKFQEEGIDFAYPTQTVFLEKD